MRRETAIEVVTNALRAAGGKASTTKLCELLPQTDRGVILAALAHLKRRAIVDSNFAPARIPDCGWTYWFSRAKRGSRYKAAVSNGFTRLVVEWLDARGGSATVTEWREWHRPIGDRIRLNSAIHSLRRRRLIEVGPIVIGLTDAGRAALAAGRKAVPMAPSLADFDPPEPPRALASTDPERSVERAERMWPRLLRGQRFGDIPAHMIRTQQLLRLSRPMEDRSLTGSSGAMLAESRSSVGGTP